jgi:hypothetical protein
MRSTLVLLLISLAGAASAQKTQTKTKYHVEIVSAEAAKDVPADLAPVARAQLEKQLSEHPEFVQKLEGAPDPKMEPDAFRKYLAAKNLRAFAVTVQLPRFSKELVPAPGGRRGQALKVSLDVQLVGTQIPGSILALGGKGSSVIQIEVGTKVRPKDEQYALDEAIREAITNAVTDTVSKLASSKPATPQRK